MVLLSIVFCFFKAKKKACCNHVLAAFVTTGVNESHLSRRDTRHGLGMHLSFPVKALQCGPSF